MAFFGKEKIEKKEASTTTSDEIKAKPVDFLATTILNMQYGDLLQFGKELLKVAQDTKDENVNTSSSWAHFMFKWAENHKNAYYSDLYGVGGLQIDKKNYTLLNEDAFIKENTGADGMPSMPTEQDASAWADKKFG